MAFAQVSLADALRDPRMGSNRRLKVVNAVLDNAVLNRAALERLVRARRGVPPGRFVAKRFGPS